MRADIIPTQEGDEETLPAHPVLPHRSQKERPVHLVGQSNSWCEDLGKGLWVYSDLTCLHYEPYLTSEHD